MANSNEPLLLKIRQQFREKSAVLNRWYPILIGEVDRPIPCLCMQVKTAVNGQLPTLHTMVIRQGRPLADMPLQVIAAVGRITSKNTLEVEGTYYSVNNERIGLWLANGLPFVPGMQLEPTDDDCVFTRQLDDDFSLVGIDPHPTAAAHARAADVGTVTLDKFTRPSGSEWHTYYLTLPDNQIKEIAAGYHPIAPLDLAVQAAKVMESDKSPALHQPDAINQRASIEAVELALAAQSGFKLGKRWEALIPTDGKQVRNCLIIKDHGNGHFDVLGHRGAQQVTMTDISASSIQHAEFRYQSHLTAKQNSQPDMASALPPSASDEAYGQQDDLFADEPDDDIAPVIHSPRMG